MITSTKKHTFAITISDNINFKEQIIPLIINCRRG